MDKLPDMADKDVGTILKTTGMTLISTVGGAAGPLYGTGFMRAGIVVGDQAELHSDDIVAALAAALEGIQSRGRAQRGEKTMVDAIAPAVDVLKAAQASGGDMRLAARAALRAAEEGMRATILMVATKGRASYLGERSAGHQDPGATSAYLIARVLFEILEDQADPTS
jgi:dihydroxyacetone kinase-like protein